MIVNAAALPNLSLPANSKQSEINEAISKVFEETLIFRDIEVFEFTKSQSTFTHIRVLLKYENLRIIFTTPDIKS